MAYGYGVWLVIKDKKIQQIVDKHNKKPHIAHVTVMCNMSDIDAFRLMGELEAFYDLTILNRHINLNGDCHKYSENDTLYASGYYCIVNKWREIVEIAKKYRGSISLRPHLTIAYRASEKDLPEKVEGTVIRAHGSVGAININDDDPSKWYYINQTKPTTG